MYHWNVRALAEDLRAGRVAQREQMKYFLPQMVLTSTTVPIGYLCVEPTAELAVEAVGVGAVSVLGVLACHDANRRGDDAEFLSRFICLSWPVAVRLLLLVLFPVICVLSVAWMLVDDRSLEILGVVLGIWSVSSRPSSTTS